jgi:GT2 family glycosyltransferase
MNTPRTLPGATRDALDAAAGVGARPVRSASFVSVLVDAGVAAERGLPVADYFLWNDDFEYTTRLIRDGVGLYVPTSVVVHKTRVFGSTDADPGDRFYWEVRNKVWMFTRSGSLSPAEKVAYGGSTLTRWIRTFIDSPDRETLRDGLRRGLVDAWSAPPRPTDEVLAAASEPSP